jgi:hypothetical protein
VADGCCWFVLRKKYCWLVAGGWFIPREKYCRLVADKPSEQAVHCCICIARGHFGSSHVKIQTPLLKPGLTDVSFFLYKRSTCVAQAHVQPLIDRHSDAIRCHTHTQPCSCLLRPGLAAAGERRASTVQRSAHGGKAREDARPRA